MSVRSKQGTGLFPNGFAFFLAPCPVLPTGSVRASMERRKVKPEAASNESSRNMLPATSSIPARNACKSGTQYHTPYKVWLTSGVGLFRCALGATGKSQRGAGLAILR